MPDFLGKLIDDAAKRVHAGYYDIPEGAGHQPISLKRAIKSSKNNAIIAEIKPISPARGPLRPQIDPIQTAKELASGGAVALSVLTESDNFGGSLENLRRIRPHVGIPLLMKDIVIHERQIDAGRKTGADCILLIESAFSKYPIASINRLIRHAHESHLEVLVEVHDEDELDRA